MDKAPSPYADLVRQVQAVNPAAFRAEREDLGEPPWAALR